MYNSVKDGVPSGEMHLTRHSAMTLYHTLKCFELTAPKQEWVDVIKKLADAFVALYEKYGKFGSYINSETGEMLIGFGSSGVGAIGGLAKAYKFFGENKYLDTALKAAGYYRNDFLNTGMTCGGPGDILSAPDSESAFMTLEAYVCLYEVTRDKKWLDFSETVAKYCSSWVVSYNHKFPEGSEFDRERCYNGVGNVFYSNCWCSNSLLMSFAELMDYSEFKD